MNIIERYESEVRSYCRSFPTMFHKALGEYLFDEDGNRYLDFFSGAGALNYGHNHPRLKEALMDYLNEDGITHSLDMFTVAKRRFLEKFNAVILQPRQMDYKIQFPGPTGTNAVESALKLARKVTGREGIVSFTNAFHGMTLGSLALTGNSLKRTGAGVPLNNVTPMPFDGYMGKNTNTLDYLKAVLEDSGSGLDKPAAVILETVQAEGGINVAGVKWLKQLSSLLKAHDILLIVDDIQVGCGRTGPFFSFEDAGIQPDIICLSKSLSGYGLPMSIVLIKPELDIREPGEHNGTFRGHNPAFVTATAALDFWGDATLTQSVLKKGEYVNRRLQAFSVRYKQLDSHMEIRGKGLIQGLAFSDPAIAGRVAGNAFEKGLVIETAGPSGEVLKILPPLTISMDSLENGLDIIEVCIRELAEEKAPVLEQILVVA